MDEVWGNVFIGDKTAAEDLELLKDLNFTHVLNAAEGDEQNPVTAQTYSDTDIKYLGFKVIDDASFDISPLLQPGALFINQGVSFPGKVLVFSILGKSRAAVFVLAYLMFYENLTLDDAFQCINRQRNVSPNIGFLRQLHTLDKKLFHQKKKKHSCCLL
ncbi:dual specificity phosphatase 29-like [Leptodactylus fuscus]